MNNTLKVSCPYVNARLDEIAELEARRAAGIVEMVSSETGRYYVVISSSIDSDLAMDYATKLSKEGNNVKVVEHEAEGWQYFGVSLADYATWDEAASAIQSFSSFGQGLGTQELKSGFNHSIPH